jgi:hypothetical protein
MCSIVHGLFSFASVFGGVETAAMNRDRLEKTLPGDVPWQRGGIARELARAKPAGRNGQTQDRRSFYLNLTCKIVLGYGQTKKSEALPLITSQFSGRSTSSQHNTPYNSLCANDGCPSRFS